MIVYISVGNSDDKLTQHEWSVMVKRTDDAIRYSAQQVHGYWLSSADSRWQNACWCIELNPEYDALITRLKRKLAWIASAHHQEAISWAEISDQQFILPQDDQEVL